ncbi:MAG: hypothetical protein CMH62_02185 [Nanoarchaeota archaeon]|nr:hypothetical protein [Nanoarchaeota archaeon]
MVLKSIDFVGFISWFEGVGGFDIILPFLLIFAITYAVLDNVGLFGEKKRNINLIIAIILAFFLIVQRDVVVLLQGFLPRISMLVLTIIIFLLVIGAFGFGELGGAWKSLSVIVAIVGVIWALGASVGWDVPALDYFTEQDIAILLILGVFVLVIWFIVKEPGTDDGDGNLKKIFRGFNDLVGAGKKS